MTARGWAQCVIGFSVADRKLASGVPAAAGARRPTDDVVLETVPAVVVVLDAQGRVVELNRAGEELTGYGGEELRGRELWETGLVPEEEQSGTREVFARLRAGDFPNRYENHWITKDGRWRLLSWRNSAVLDEYGEVSRVIGTAVDVTDERRALDALQESAERFRATLQTLIDPLVLLTAARDADGKVVDFVCAFANDAACAVSGVTREELIGRRLLEFLPESRSSGLFDAFVRVIETGEPFNEDDLVVAVGGDLDETERHLNSASRESAIRSRSRGSMRPNAAASRRNSGPASSGSMRRPGRCSTRSRSSHRFVVMAARSSIFATSIRRDGAVVYALMGSTAVLDADGRPSMLFTQVQDITERKQAEAALRASEERFRGGFENSPIGMALVDLNGRYLDVNSTHARMLGVDDPHEMVGLSFEHFVHPDDVADTYASIKRLHETGTDHGERRYIRKDGAIVYALFGSSVVRDADGRPSVLFGQVQDITERKLAEAEVRRLNAELEQRVLRRTAELRAANQELEGFAYSLAHDLRAPVRAINGFGAALSQSHGDELGDEGRETLDRIRRASAKMGGEIDAMLLLLELIRRELSITSVDLSAVAREISEQLRARDPARGVEFASARQSTPWAGRPVGRQEPHVVADRAIT